MIGPLLGGMLVDMYNMSALFIVLIGLFLIAIVTTLLYDRILKTKMVSGTVHGQF
jgi:predicted MFS family arabinose efflux permease